jgi:predicted amidophosphoribosyltransferase
MKDIQDRTGKVNALKAVFAVEDSLSTGVFDVLIVDDLFDTGSSLEAATDVLKSHSKVRNVFAAVVTRKRDE